VITVPATYPIGTAGQPWGTAEREEWRSRQSERSYVVDVLAVLERLRSRFDVVQYGELDYAPDRYSLFAIKSRDWRDDLAVALVTGGVHGYETSGVHGALQFVERHGTDYAGRINLLVIPCVTRGDTNEFIAGTRMPSTRTARSANPARRRSRRQSSGA
jgi:hypothetical protein